MRDCCQSPTGAGKLLLDHRAQPLRLTSVEPIRNVVPHRVQHVDRQRLTRMDDRIGDGNEPLTSHQRVIDEMQAHISIKVRRLGDLVSEIRPVEHASKGKAHTDTREAA